MHVKPHSIVTLTELALAALADATQVGLVCVQPLDVARSLYYKTYYGSNCCYIVIS
jgi:hypothetical protein